MKKTIGLILSMNLVLCSAQDLTSKKGEPILPEAKDWSIGIDATPFLNYAGNLLSGSGSSNQANWNFLSSDKTIIGKYFKDEKTAYRGTLRIGINNRSDSKKVYKPTTATPTFPAILTTTEDKAKYTRSYVGLGFGMEKRRGRTRLQGYYGADLMIWFTSSKRTYTYGNDLNPTGTPAVTVMDPNYSSQWNDSISFFGGNIVKDTYGNDARVTESKSGVTFGMGVRGFIGAEYFIFPKISVAGEFGWGVAFTTGARTSVKTESINNTDVGEQTILGGKSGGSFMLDTDRNMFGTGSGSLRLNLHF